MFGPDFLKQAKEITGKFEDLKSNLAQKTVDVTVGGGMVKVTANGQQEIVSIEIEDDIINVDEKDMLQEMVIAGVNEALRKAGEMAADELKGITNLSGLFNGLNIPGLG